MLTPGWLPIAQQLVRCVAQQHEWKRIRPIVDSDNVHHNARCCVCGQTAWMHWAPK